MRVLIAAGGTAGHINPALAIAGAIKKADPSAEIHFAGRKEGMEYRLVTQAGYPFHHIVITGFQRRLSLNNIKRNIITLWNLALSGPKARAMMKEVQPDLVIGCGGYVSGPVVRCAAKKGIKTAIHEQNAFPGVTNKLLAPDVDIVFAAVPAAVEKLGAPEKTQVVGNPVRPEVFEKAGERDAIRAQLGAGDRTVILSFGGSLGARRVNEVVAVAVIVDNHDFARANIAHQFGANNIERAGFGSEHISAVFHLAEGKRAETVRIKRADHGVFGHDQVGETAMHGVERFLELVHERTLCGAAQQVHQHFGVGIGVEDGAFVFKLAAQ